MGERYSRIREELRSKDIRIYDDIRIYEDISDCKYETINENF